MPRETEVERLRALADERGGSVTRLVDRVQDVAQERDRALTAAAEAQAEVERLRAALAERASPGALQDMFARLNDTETKLAAANALLERCRAGFDWNQYDAAEQNQIGRDLDAHLAGHPKAETVECESCAMRGRDCDNGDHCDNCGARMDGDLAATAEVCLDCWRAAKERTAAEQRVLDAMRNFKLLYNELPAIPSAQQWKRLCEVTMKTLEGWPEHDDDAELARREGK